MREVIEAAIAAGPAPAAAPAATPVAVSPAHAPTPQATAATPKTDDRTEVVALSRIRLVTAERMVESLRIAPHVFTSIEVDLERVEQVRQRHKDRFRKEEGAGLTYLVFIARAVCDALRAFPTVNASVDIDTKTMSLHHYVNLGIAVDLDEQGLAVPVIRDADSLNLRGLARAIKAKAEGARTRTLSPDDYAGSTFTITSPGAMGDYTAAPIINQPNVAILAAPVVSRRPVAVGDAVAIHHMTILGFCYDHRAFDGVTASRFMAHVRDALQERDWEAELG
jgi:2-oxoglutarate dehydrogenase E2 component (dihydrolipoamide succinyltransferase)